MDLGALLIVKVEPLESETTAPHQGSNAESSGCMGFLNIVVKVHRTALRLKV